MEQQMLFENLDELLESGTAVITTKWLSLQFDLPIREAECTLAAYSKARDDISAVFLLSGFLNSHEMVVKIVPLDRVDNVYSEFSSPPTLTIYSVQRQQCRDSTTLASVDQLLDLTAGALKKLTTIPWVEPSPREKATPVATGNAVPIIPKIVATGKDQQVNVKRVNNFFAPITKRSTSTTNKVLQSITEKHPVADTEGAASNSLTVVMNDNDDDDDDGIGRPRNSGFNSYSGTRKRVIESDDEDEGQKSDVVAYAPASSVKSSPNELKTSTNKSESKTRHPRGKQTVIVSDSETDSPLTRPSTAIKSTRKLETPKRKAKVVCSSSVGNTDLSLQSSTSNRGKSAITETTTIPRVHHHAMKTFIDEDGFMVTEKVWESVPVVQFEDVEVEEKRPGSASAVASDGQTKERILSKPLAAQSTKISRTPSKSAKPSKVKQASMSAFLTKGRNTS